MKTITTSNGTYYEGTIDSLSYEQIFVFGSNTEGRHGKGAALKAKEKFGAKYGQSHGIQGKSYAIVTKDLTKKNHPSITESHIESQIHELYEYAREHDTLEFLVAYRGTSSNLNGYSPQQMAKMFGSSLVPSNIIFERTFHCLVFGISLSHEALF